MSRITIEAIGQFAELTVGWDQTMGKYFAQGFLVGEQEPALWEQRQTLEELLSEISACGVSLPAQVTAKLVEHGQNSSDERLAWDVAEGRLW